MGVPYTFGTATTSIPLSNLDANFNTPVTIGNATVGLGNTVTTVGNLTLTNATISSGNVTVTTGIFGAGSNTAPSITTTGDTNTGIFFPAADTIAFTEGGVESMRIDSSGNVGIGTSSPLAKLNVQGSTTAKALFNITGYGGLEIGHNADFTSEINQKSGQALLFKTSDTERMRIDSSGNVGIGTSSPTKLLTVFKTQNAETSILVRNESTGTAGKAIIRFGNSNSDDVGSVGALSSGFTPSGALEADGFYVDSGRQSLNLSASNSGIIKFFGTGTERMRMSGGTLFIGATSSPSGTQRLVLAADGSAGIEPMLFNELRATSATENYVRFYRNGNQVGAITNTLSATAYVTSSDYRLKDNVVPMTGALAKVSQLKPVTYKWKVDGSDGQGFIAHELQAVVPDCVSGVKDGEQMQGVDYGKITPLLTAALQEALAKIESLEARLAVLESK